MLLSLQQGDQIELAADVLCEPVAADADGDPRVSEPSQISDPHPVCGVGSRIVRDQDIMRRDHRDLGICDVDSVGNERLR
jgi:hypothetical protein